MGSCVGSMLLASKLPPPLSRAWFLSMFSASWTSVPGGVEELEPGARRVARVGVVVEDAGGAGAGPGQVGQGARERVGRAGREGVGVGDAVLLRVHGCSSGPPGGRGR